MIPTEIKLTPKEVTSMRKLNDKRAGMDTFIRTIMQQGEARMAEIQAEGQTVWLAIAANHGIDIRAVNYEVSDDGETLVPTGMKL